MSFTFPYRLVILVTYSHFSFSWILYIFFISSPLSLYAAIEFHLTDSCSDLLSEDMLFWYRDIIYFPSLK